MNQGLLSVDDALQLLLSKARAVVDIEEVPALEATHRVLARAQRSTMDVPPMDNSAMDGYAVRTADLKTGSKLRVAQKIMAGGVGKPLEPGTAARIFTGAPIPPGADAVVMQEDTSAEGESVSLKKIPNPAQWVRYVGSDIRKGAEILPAGKRLLPQDTGLGASVGEADYVKPAVEAEGRLLMWRIAMKPGRPLAFGKVGDAAFIGLPGNPVSSFVTFLIFVRPFLLRTQGVSAVEAKAVAARA